ncbi:MAG: FixH family protein [Chloroflexi bacterium]|nr:FixH family protein [Chloroflexota bacterium]
MRTAFNRKLLFFAAFLLALTACAGRASQQTDNVDLNIAVAFESTQVGPTTLTLTLHDADGAPINDAAITVKGDMSHAGMVPVLAKASNGQNGVYEMPFTWTMGGDWIVTVEVELGDGRTATQQFTFSIAQ